MPQVAELLPKLSEDGYSIEPSLTQLAAMARDDPRSLAAVSGFRVSRQGVGSVRWLEPTDVRGLDVNGTVRLTKGAVEVWEVPVHQPKLAVHLLLSVCDAAESEALNDIRSCCISADCGISYVI